MNEWIGIGKNENNYKMKKERKERTKKNTFDKMNIISMTRFIIANKKKLMIIII